jgi:hypothetical protein
MSFEGNVWGAIIAIIMLANTLLTLRGNRLTQQNGLKTDEVNKVINRQNHERLEPKACWKVRES